MSKVSIPSSNVSFFDNVNIDHYEMTFDLHNHRKISVAFANAIRRILMCEIKMISISKKYIHFIRNSTMLNDSILANRLTLIPINEEWVNRQSFPMSEIEVRYHKVNRGELIESIYVQDFEVCHIHPESLERRVIRDHDLFPRPRILFAKMKPGQELHFTALLDNKTAHEEGSTKSHTCSAIFTYKKDDAAIQQHIAENGLTGADLQDFLLLESAKRYLMNEEQEPTTYQFLIESIGIHTPDKLFEKALDRFKEKLEYYMPLTEDRVLIEQSKTSFMAYDFLMDNEDDTIGNIISYTMGKKEDVSYSGYVKEHPLIKKMIIRLSLSDTTISEKTKYMEKMQAVLQEIIDQINELKEQWKQMDKTTKKAKPVTPATIATPAPVQPQPPQEQEQKRNVPTAEEIPEPAIEPEEEPKKKKTIRRKTTKKSAN